MNRVLAHYWAIFAYALVSKSSQTKYFSKILLRLSGLLLFSALRFDRSTEERVVVEPITIALQELGNDGSAIPRTTSEELNLCQ